MTIKMWAFALCLSQVISESIDEGSCAVAPDLDDVGDATSLLATNRRPIEHHTKPEQEQPNPPCDNNMLCGPMKKGQDKDKVEAPAQKVSLAQESQPGAPKQIQKTHVQSLLDAIKTIEKTMKQ